MISDFQSSYIDFIEVWKLPVPLRAYVFFLAEREVISVSKKSQVSSLSVGNRSKQSTGFRPQTEALWVHYASFPLHALSLFLTLSIPLSISSSSSFSPCSIVCATNKRSVCVCEWSQRTWLVSFIRLKAGRCSMANIGPWKWETFTHTHTHTLKEHTSNTRLICAHSPGQDIPHLFSKWSDTHSETHTHTHTHSDHILTLLLARRANIQAHKIKTPQTRTRPHFLA